MAPLITALRILSINLLKVKSDSTLQHVSRFLEQQARSAHRHDLCFIFLLAILSCVLQFRFHFLFLRKGIASSTVHAAAAAVAVIMAKKTNTSFKFGLAGLATASTAQPAVSTAADTKDAFGGGTLFGLATASTAQPAVSTAADAKDALGESNPLFQSFERSLNMGTTASSTEKRDKPLFTYPGMPRLVSQWRNVDWTEEKKTNLMKAISSYSPRSRDVTKARVLLLGPVNSGKSSFISSVQSVFNGRVTNRAMVGSSTTSFTKKLQSFCIHGRKGEDTSGLVLCDIMGLGDGETTGVSLHDVLSVIKGHVPEGHKFSPEHPVSLSETVGYVKRPSLREKIHCVAFVVNATKILTHPKVLTTTFQQLREHISDLGVHQVALLTHIDQVSPETAKDVSMVYKSQHIRGIMDKAGALLGMSTSYIIPVRNYSSELDLDVNADVLLLSAVDHILQYADLFFQDNTSQYADRIEGI